MCLVQIIRHTVVIRAIDLQLRLRRASHADLRVPLFQRLLPSRQRFLILSVLWVVLVGQVVGERLVVDLLVVEAGVAEDLLRLVAARRIAGWVASKAVEELLFCLLGSWRSCRIWCVEDVAFGVEKVDCFARGALELWDARSLRMC
jgi:hypothetical protein